ncbi:DUF3151 domain-containing protein [Cellulomonas sp. PhB143]|uniref:DUF3151 domain-containing protein n=1 Tax=Cellulomonas sp. PhB143 TaxID=2485186 RepID=UPI000F4A5882|nr:DUF3151 domain-containing protein [Cellulomonas sp. PhB143]ROS76504.1 uncharacterized protein DUF3151 [Cellulomonas sp. PhB143]
MTDAAHPPVHGRNLLDGPAPVRLGDDHPDLAARRALEDGVPVDDAARRFPASSYVWAVLAEGALDAGDPVAAYAYARTGYHRGLDALRRAGWRGQGPIPADHRANQGILRAVLALADAAEAIGEEPEAQRCTQLLLDSGTSADEVRALR